MGRELVSLLPAALAPQNALTSLLWNLLEGLPVLRLLAAVAMAARWKADECIFYDTNLSKTACWIDGVGRCILRAGCVDRACFKVAVCLV